MVFGFGSKSGEQFMVDDPYPPVVEGQPPDDKAIFHKLTYIPNEETKKAHAGPSWYGSGNEKPLSNGDTFDATITNAFNYNKTNPVTVDIKCIFRHVIFYTPSTTGAEDKKHNDVAVTFDIIEPSDFLTKYPVTSFRYFSYQPSDKGIDPDTGKVQMIETDDPNIKYQRVFDLIISSSGGGGIFGKGITRDDAFIHSLIKHHTDVTVKSKSSSNPAVNGADVDASLKKVPEAAGKLGAELEKTADALTPKKGGKKRKTYRKKSSKKHKKRRITKKRRTDIRNKNKKNV